MKLSSVLIAVASVFAAANASASNITVSTGFSDASAQATAADYQSVVNAAVAVASSGYGSLAVGAYDNISNYLLFGSTSSNIAFKSVIDFGVSAANVGAWDFRFGVDFGKGGAVFLDGVAFGTKSNDMWWNGSYSSPDQFFAFSSTLAAGNHQLSVYGLENCCDGGQQAQFRSPATATFTTFNGKDGLNVAAVPEPETYAMLLAGLGLMGAVARRRKQK